MGAWGCNPFENDSALDARARIRGEIEKKLWFVLRRHKDSDDEALAYVEMLIRLREAPYTEEFGVAVAEKMIANFNEPQMLHRRIARKRNGCVSKRVKGRRGDVWNDPEKRLRVIRRTLKRWQALRRPLPLSIDGKGMYRNPCPR